MAWRTANALRIHTSRVNNQHMVFLQQLTRKIRSQHWTRKVCLLLAGLMLGAWIFSLPDPLFDDPYCAVLEDRNGQLLGARIATDGQWRFPSSDTLPEKYARCLVAFEDRRFYHHPGVDPFRMVGAAWQNMRSGKVVSGASTLSMQVVRMARNNPPRTAWEKAIEIALALRLEAGYSKKQILKQYAAQAPFGGNVVGLEAAAWRYFGKHPRQLSWAEAATMAVLPNAPGLLHPGRRSDELMRKRNRLLGNMARLGAIDSLDLELALAEPMPGPPHPLPDLAPHVLDRVAKGRIPGVGRRLYSCLDALLQEQTNQVLSRWQAVMKNNGVHNMAAVIIHVPTGEVLAYAGNTRGAGAAHGESVDCAVAARSTGSILKPYLYALALEGGHILPGSLLRDVPTQLGRYRPENYLETYDGAVPARRALIRSLNVPFVLLLQQYGLAACHYNFRRLGLTTLNKGPDHYGLSLILGGAEASLIDITNVYAGMGRVLGFFYQRDGRYAADDFRPPSFLRYQSRDAVPLKAAPLLSAASVWFAFEAMQQVERPLANGSWELFQGSRPVAWKTGTSFGFRDAWAAGVTPGYAVGVWVGNADGEGRAGLIGVQAAAPVLFDLLGLLPADGWFAPPWDDMVRAAVCPQSGYRAGALCPSDTIWIPKTGMQAEACTHHQMLHLDPTAQWQVNSSCMHPDDMRHTPWFVLPPTEAHYFARKNPWYKPPPPMYPDCVSAPAGSANRSIQLIYPKESKRIYVPLQLDGRRGEVVFEAVHQQPSSPLYWHLDGQYLGMTSTFHQMSMQPGPGKHRLVLVDPVGHRLEHVFEVVDK
jgi:penicillin-binding protein 1C